MIKRLAFLVLLLAAFVPSAAHAAVPCRDRIYNDWYADGKIDTNYPIACYKDALAHVPADAKIYSSLTTDINSAMQGALARLHGKKVPAQVGKGEPKSGTGAVADATYSLHRDTSTTASASTTTTGATAAGATSSGGSGLPLPILILGALAILLAAAGAAGAGVRRYRGRPNRP